MQDPLISRKLKSSLEINWEIREIFSVAALDSFCDEICNYYLTKEKNKE